MVFKLLLKYLSVNCLDKFLALNFSIFAANANELNMLGYSKERIHTKIAHETELEMLSWQMCQIMPLCRNSTMYSDHLRGHEQFSVLRCWAPYFVFCVFTHPCTCPENITSLSSWTDWAEDPFSVDSNILRGTKNYWCWGISGNSWTSSVWVTCSLNSTQMYIWFLMWS